MADDLVLSASSVATFLRCGQQWYYAYVANIKRPPSVKQAIGLASHGAVEYNMRQKLRSQVDAPLDEVLDAYSDSWNGMAADLEPDEAEEDAPDPAKAKDSGIQIVRKHHTEVAPAIQPLYVEEPIQFDINGIQYSGTVDLVDQKRRVRDLKTTGRTPGKGKSHLLQMTGYAIGFRQATAEVESEVMLDYFVYYKKKAPVYLPIASGGPIDNGHIVTFSKIVHDVHDQIMAGRFLPNGIEGTACGWCGYREICPAYKEYRT